MLGNFYGKTPDQLLSLDADDLEMAYLCWQAFKEDEADAYELARRKAEANAAMSRMLAD